jgi:TPP-dependent pyruvate/acetoin dehydrogenase alpha subunit
MKRYPPYDPPEYVEWAPQKAVLDEYRNRFDERPELLTALKRLGRDGIGRVYRGLVRFRLHDVALKRWVRTGVLTKAWLGTGEEAVTIGAVHALGPEDVVGPMIRNAAAAFERGISLADCFKVYLATGDTITRGRDLHIGDLDHGVVAPISHVGDLVPVIAGFALAFRYREEDRVGLTWVGDGATRTGASHEGISFASALRLPMIVIVQDNEVALGTRRDDRMERSLANMAEGYGVEGLTCDGNHVIEVYEAVRRAREICVAGNGPVILLARTFRMGGHATHDEAEGRALFPESTFREWGARDPIACFEEYLRGEKFLGKNPDRVLERWETQVTAEVEQAVEDALRSAERKFGDRV